MVAVSSAALRKAYAALLYAGAVAWIGGAFLASSTGDSYWAYVLLWPGLLAFLASQVCKGMLLFRAWRCVSLHADPRRAGTRVLDPGAAVALTFVPGVNVVGMFFSLGWLPAQLNRIASRSGIARKADESLGYFSAGMVACAAIPVVGVLVAFAAVLGVMPGLVLQCSALAEVIEGRLGAAEPHPVPSS